MVRLEQIAPPPLTHHKTPAVLADLSTSFNTPDRSGINTDTGLATEETGHEKIRSPP
jgi:hypothetical protein